MIGGHYFKRLGNRGARARAALRADDESLRKLISRHVCRPFARTGSPKLPVMVLTLPTPTDAEGCPAALCHPACAEYAESDYCRESWQLHLAELHARPGAHWHKCDHGMLCGVVPVVHDGRCLAALKLACPATMSERVFERHVGHLKLLVDDLVRQECEFLSRLAVRKQAEEIAGEARAQAAELAAPRPPEHPQVVRALEFITDNLSDPKLNVARVASYLGIHPDYLSRIFSGQVGQRLSRFIAAQRVELAKRLLTTTNWQVKRIARETGHANANWFCHVFLTHTNHTPLGYRKSARR